ncbi:ABC transporter permease subunit [Propionicimonas paludicola]|nr:ABC transporter permease subunit [Propionicimonas paludicola]
MTTPALATTTSRSAQLPRMLRTFAVEFRKLVNTRAALALLASAAVLAGVFGGGAALTAGPHTDFGQIARLAGTPGGIVLMVMAVLLITSEFTTRTAAVTFTLNPRRGEVLAAKVAVILVMTLALTVLSVIAAALVMQVAPLMTGRHLPWTMDLPRLAVFTATSALMACAGLAFGLAVRNAPAPLVILLVWPMVSSMVSTASPASTAVLDYLDQGAAAALLVEPMGPAIAKLATSVLVWVVVPGVIGTVRLLRGDLS